MHLWLPEGCDEDVRQLLALHLELGRQFHSADSSERWLHLDLTMAQLKVLMALFELQVAAVKTLATRLGVSLSTVSVLLEKLVEQGLVVREEDPSDRRVVLNRLSAAGEELLRGLVQVSLEQLAAAFARMSVEERQHLRLGMEALLRAVQAAPGAPVAAVS